MSYRKGTAPLRAAEEWAGGICAAISLTLRSEISGLQWERRVTVVGRLGSGGPGFPLWYPKSNLPTHLKERRVILENSFKNLTIYKYRTFPETSKKGLNSSHVPLYLGIKLYLKKHFQLGTIVVIMPIYLMEKYFI